MYETADGGFLSVGALEPRFCAELIRLSGVGGDGSEVPSQFDQASWPAVKLRLATVFRTKTRSEWCELLEGTDACVAPVLGLGEAPGHPHNAHRGTFTESSGVVQPAPAPRFSRTPGSIGRPPPHAGQHTDEVLGEWGFQQSDIDSLRAAGAIK